MDLPSSVNDNPGVSLIFGCCGIVFVGVVFATLSMWWDVRRAARRNPAAPGLTRGQRLNHAVHSWDDEEQQRKQAKAQAWQDKKAKWRRQGRCEWCGSRHHSSSRHWTA